MKLFLTLLAFTAIAAVALGAPGAGGQQPGFVATPTPTEPPGIVAPLGRYEEPPSPLPSTEAVPAAPGLISTTNAPSVTTGFNGIGQEPDGSGFIHSPPDTHAAAGPDRIVEITNGHVAIYNKTGGLIVGGDSGAGAVDLATFCGSSDCFDPKVIYDQASQRFVAVAIEGSQFTDSFLHVMVSTNSTPGNLTTDWDKFRHAAGTNITSNGWFDYPGLGVSPDAVVVTGNIFTDADVFQGTKIRVFDKAELYDGDATATFVDIDRDPASGGGTTMPAHHFGNPPSGTFYLLQGWGPAFLRVTALTGVPSSPTASNALISTSDQGVCVGSAPQQGTTKLIDTVCPRMMNAAWRDGSLWGTLTGSDSADVRTVVQWFEIETNGFPSASPTLRQHGAIDEGAGEFTFMPSISVDSCGNAALTYTQSSSSRFPEMRYTGRLSTDTLNTLQASSIAKASAFFFDDFTGLPDVGPDERWGDYSATVVDPSDGSFWIAHQYARVAATGGNDGRWGTWLANFTFGCTPPPTPTPTPCPTGGCPTPTITPTATVTPTATITPTVTVTPTPIQSEMILNVKGGAFFCAPSKCDVPVNGKFTLAVEVVEMPAGGYVGVQTFIDYGPDLTYDSSGTSEADEIVWPDCSPVIAIRGEPGPTFVAHACLTGLLPPLPVSSFIGNIVEISVTCSTTSSTTEIRLLPLNDPDAGASGAAFFLEDLVTQVVPKVSNLTINCVVPSTPTPTATPTPTPTATPTPTKQPDPGDTDGDGCSDVRENLPKAQADQGGGRDYLNPWDFYDTNGDQVIDLLFDILGVIQHYSPQGAPPYDVAFDRGPTTGPNPWNMTAPDGAIDLLNDILGVIQQANHDCR